jgi:hypothetical protein
MGEMIGNCTPVAGKIHTCYWCGQKILKGEKYSRWTWVDGGNASTIKAHMECATAWGGIYENDNVAFGEHCRGCDCEKGHCICVKNTPTPAGEKGSEEKKG